MSKQGTNSTNAGRNIAKVDLSKMSNFIEKIKIRWVAGEMDIYFFIMFYKAYMIKILLSESNIRLKMKSGNREQPKQPRMSTPLPPSSAQSGTWATLKFSEM